MGVMEAFPTYGTVQEYRSKETQAREDLEEALCNLAEAMLRDQRGMRLLLEHRRHTYRGLIARVEEAGDALDGANARRHDAERLEEEGVNHG